jgi:hypothetical protein
MDYFHCHPGHLVTLPKIWPTFPVLLYLQYLYRVQRFPCSPDGNCQVSASGFYHNLLYPSRYHDPDSSRHLNKEKSVPLWYGPVRRVMRVWVV